MTTQNDILQTIRFDVARMIRNVTTLRESCKITKDNPESFKKAIIAKLDMPKLEAAAQRISESLEEFSEMIVVDMDMPTINKEDKTLGKGATAEEIMAAMEAMPKLSDKVIRAIEDGVRQSKEMPLPDSS